VASDAYHQLKSMPIPRGKISVDVPNFRASMERKATPLLSPTGGAGSTFLGPQAAVSVPIPGALGIITTTPVSTGAIEHLRISSDLSTQKAAKQHPEGSTKAAIQLTSVDVTAKVATTAAYTKISTQLLADAVGLQNIIDNLLTAMVLLVADRQLLVGAGPASGELDGILDDVTAYDSSADVTGDTGIDTLSHAILQLANAGVMANAAVVTPAAAETLRLTKDSTGTYLAGYPSTQGTPAIWSLQIISDPNLVGSGSDFIVGNFGPAYLQLATRETVTVDVALENEDDFIKNLAALRAEMRRQTALYYPGVVLQRQLPGRRHYARCAHASRINCGAKRASCEIG
jgi:HK97 family phage major capsid protein